MVIIIIDNEYDHDNNTDNSHYGAVIMTNLIQRFSICDHSNVQHQYRKAQNYKLKPKYEEQKMYKNSQTY